MTISYKCSCGKSYRLKEEMAGKKVRCPNCNAVQTVPVPKPPEEPMEVELEEVPPPRQSQHVQEAPRKPRPMPIDDEPEEGRRPRRRRYEDDDDYDDRSPVARKVRRPKRRSYSRGGGGGIAIN